MSAANMVLSAAQKSLGYTRVMGATGDDGLTAGQVAEAASVLNRRTSDGYFCHLLAGVSDPNDAAFCDISGAEHHGAFGALLTKTLAWAAPGFCSTANALANQNIVLANLNWDYLNGESLMVVWKGRATPLASTKGLIGNSPGSSSPGFSIRLLADGSLQPYISGGTGVFLDPTAAGVVSAGTTCTYAFIVDGLARKYEAHTNGVVTRTLIAISAGAAIDTRTTSTLNIGCTDQVTATQANSIASAAQALVVLRGRVGLGLPAGYQNLAKKIARNPWALVSALEW